VWNLFGVRGGDWRVGRNEMAGGFREGELAACGRDAGIYSLRVSAWFQMKLGESIRPGLKPR
jgi:hypothetical protein